MEKKLPLFIVTGASGVGKTTVTKELRVIMPDFDVFETDMFPKVADPLDFHGKRTILLRFAYAVAQSGRGTIICGTIMPWDLEKCDDYSRFREVCFINLHCDDDTRNNRLRNRTDKAIWTDEMLKSHENFAQWLLDNASIAYNPPMPTIDTTSVPPAEVAMQIKRYVMQKWNRAEQVSKVMKFNVEEAVQFGKQGCLEEWVHIFLKTIGDNVGFSDGLKLQKRYWAGPIMISIDELQRCCGPEENMEYYNPLDSWENQINIFCKLIQEGWEYAPLIVQHNEGKLIINDGNHRHEAMKRLNFKECPVILWDSENPNNLDKWVK